MIVLIKNLPTNTKEAELRDLVASSLKIGFFLPFWRGKIKKTGIFFIQETDGNRFTYYGIVFLSSRKAGLRVIKQLNGRRFKQRVIQVREFITRSRTNDRRLTQKRGPQDFLEKRKTERRRDVWDHVSNEKRLVAASSIFERENVYLPRRQR
ncbi:MAG: RNA-binding protein [Methylococcaceae bacterium]|nr:RNA-binding protein [Methylococcaceae bacterium]